MLPKPFRHVWNFFSSSLREIHCSRLKQKHEKCARLEIWAAKWHLTKCFPVLMCISHHLSVTALCAFSHCVCSSLMAVSEVLVCAHVFLRSWISDCSATSLLSMSVRKRNLRKREILVRLRQRHIVSFTAINLEVYNSQNYIPHFLTIWTRSNTVVNVRKHACITAFINASYLYACLYILWWKFIILYTWSVNLQKQINPFLTIF